MGNRPFNDSRALAAAKAAYWQSRLASGDLSSDEKRQYVQWLKESPSHIREILEITALASLLEDARLTAAPAESNARNKSNVIPFPPPEAEPAGATSTNARPDTGKTAASVAISSSYLAYFQKQNRPTKLTLGGLTLLFVTIALLGFAASLPAAFVALGFLAVVMLKERVVRYRIKHGLFGNTASEARTLLRFVVDHADSIDFTDGDGKRRPVFEHPAPSTEHVTSPTGALAE